jgi:hypothetical protein
MRQPTIRLPTIHLNGTSKAALLDGYLDAVSAVFAATEALSEAAPNARDYYPQGDDAFKQAQDEHNARMMKLNSVLFELQQLAEHVA